MVLLGCKPKGRHTEQHDVFFGIATSVRDLVPAILRFWPEAKGKIHLDAYREVKHVDGYQVEIAEKKQSETAEKLFFINLGGYKPNVFDEAHHKVLKVAISQAEAVSSVKRSEFFKSFNSPHVDDKYGLDVDDIFDVTEMLSDCDREKYSLVIKPKNNLPADELVLGYMPVDRL